MRCDACRKKCYPITCAYCNQSICIPCRDPQKHKCLTKDQLVKRYEEKLRINSEARGSVQPGALKWEK